MSQKSARLCHRLGVGVFTWDIVYYYCAAVVACVCVCVREWKNMCVCAWEWAGVVSGELQNSGDKWMINILISFIFHLFRIFIHLNEYQKQNFYCFFATLHHSYCFYSFPLWIMNKKDPGKHLSSSSSPSSPFFLLPFVNKWLWCISRFNDHRWRTNTFPNSIYMLRVGRDTQSSFTENSPLSPAPSQSLRASHL